jgi:hypothetical protein
MNIRLVSLLIAGLLIIGCQDKLKEVSEDKFIGIWEIKGRDMFDGIQIKIERQDKQLIGKVTKINDNKFVKMFSETNDIWVSEIKRSSNFEFKLTEKKIARDLFSLYGLPTSQQFTVQFIDDNTIGLGTETSDPQNSQITYKRVE